VSFSALGCAPRPRRLALLLTLLAVGLSCRGGGPIARRRARPDKPKYDEVEVPGTKTVDHVDTYHGVEVPDPYR